MQYALRNEIARSLGMTYARFRRVAEREGLIRPLRRPWERVPISPADAETIRRRLAELGYARAE